MIIFYRILIFAASLVVGILILIKTEPIVRMIGHMGWAERRFGGGGTYLVWKLIGLIIIVFGVLVLFGTLSFWSQ
jgi:uncharacterized membrane protein